MNICLDKSLRFCIYFYPGKQVLITVTKSNFVNNSAADDGGVLHNSSADTSITNCTFTENTAYDEGGAILISDDSEVTITNSVFERNEAITGSGGAIVALMYASEAPQVEITNTTVWQNVAGGNGGGIRNGGSSSLTVTNSILWANTSINSGKQLSNNATATSIVSYTDIMDGCAVPSCATETSEIMDLPPEFIDPDNSDFNLPWDSPCVNSGNNDALPLDTVDLDEDDIVDETIPFDLAMNPRVVESTVDMGAYENQSPYDPDGGLSDGEIVDAGL